MVIFMFVVLILIILFIILFLIYKNSNKHKSLARFIFFVYSISFILEFTVFQYRSYESMHYQEYVIEDYKLGESLKLNRNGSISILENKYNYIEINSINKHLDNIAITLKTDDNQTIKVHYGYTDAANAKYAFVDGKRVLSNREDIFRLHLAGKSKRFRIYIDQTDEEKPVYIESITFNKKVPFNFTLTRPILIMSFALLFYVFRPKSKLYQMSLFKGNAKKIIYITAGAQIVFLLGISQLNQYLVQEQFPTKQRFQYQLLAEALLKGHTYLDEEPSKILQDLKNPYDKKARNNAFNNTGDYYIWDVAYFNHHYYVYFGVAPVILYYLPVYAITGHHIKTVTCISITMIATVVGIFLLLYQICKKWFSKVNLGTYLLLTLLFINSCGILFIMGRPDHYSLPILMAIMFSIYGLYWWFKAKYNHYKPFYLFLGSLCMASIAACRPQLLVTSFFAIPIFFKDIFKDRELFSKKSVGKTIALVTPYIVIAGLLMFYNYTRFGSPFDFGANYNLTTNDMTKRGFVFDRSFLGIYYYLFNPIHITLQFPFITRVGVTTSYIGTTIYENMGAGFMFINFLTLITLFAYKFKDLFKDKLPYIISILGVIFAFILIVADTQMAGILPRYVCDFGFLIYLSTSILLFAIYNHKKDELLNKICYIAFVVGILYSFFLLFSDSNVMNSWIFFYLRRIFEFWV